MRAPQTPQVPEVRRPAVPTAPASPGLAVPRRDAAPDRSVTAPAAPPPEKTAKAEAPPERTEARIEEASQIAGVRPKQRPDRPDPPAQTQPQRAQAPQAAASPAQRAKGDGAGAHAGARQQSSAATLSASQRQTLAAQWGAQVRSKIERRKRYPGGAGGASGTVRVRLTVGRDGSLRGLALAGSSGHRALDQAALRAVRAARRFPAAPRGLTRPSYTFTLAMRFDS
jgi:protein TonB